VVVVGLVLVGAAACGGGAVDHEPVPVDAPPVAGATATTEASAAGPPPGPVPPGVVPEGFATAAVVVVDPEGRRLERCVFIADTPELRARGLMGVTDLGGLDGMLFVFDADVTGGFWMRDTVLPLSLAYLDDRGAVVSVVDMEPCPPGASCPTYPPAGPYRRALEVPRGALGAFGLVAGARLEVTGAPCTAAVP
jgi:uncharacterized membrane protein (UPF0127 family)